MTSGFITLHLLLAANSFLFVMNLYLRGSKRQTNETVLGLVWVVLLLLAFLVFNWRVALVAFAFSFIYMWLSKPLARTLARRLVGYRTGIAQKEGSSGIEQFMKGDITVEELFAANQREEEARHQRLTSVSNRAAIAAVLIEKGKTFEDLEACFEMLRVTGVDDDVTWEIVSDSKDLRRLFELRDQGRSSQEIVSRLLHPD